MTPIFVLGLQRSGTTWLANLLEAHPGIAAVASEDHNGVHESIFFSHFARAFGPWEDSAARQAFREAYKHSDYWLLTGLPETILSDIMAEASSYADVFRGTMDRIAFASGAKAWVEKSPHHSLMAEDIRRAIPDARFVMVLRDTEDMVLSRLSGFGRDPSRNLKRVADIARAAAVNVLFERRFSQMARDPAFYLVRYDALRGDTDGALTGILGFLGLSAPQDPLVSRFAPNSSFSDRASRPSLSALDRAVLRMSSAIARLVPLGPLSRIHASRDSARGVDWPDWCWKRSGWSPDEASEA
ncbi:MAG: sulfotransferase [Pseudomonadota bacterium]